VVEFYSENNSAIPSDSKLSSLPAQIVTGIIRVASDLCRGWVLDLAYPWFTGKLANEGWGYEE